MLDFERSPEPRAPRVTPSPCFPKVFSVVRVSSQLDAIQCIGSKLEPGTFFLLNLYQKLLIVLIFVKEREEVRRRYSSSIDGILVSAGSRVYIVKVPPPRKAVQ